MTRLFVAVLLVVSVFYAEADPPCTGCLADGVCKASGTSETNKIEGGTETCTCTGTTWACTALGDPVFQEEKPEFVMPPIACLGCLDDDGDCREFGYKRVRPIEGGTETCVCDDSGWACEAVGIPIAQTPPPTIGVPLQLPE